MQRDVRYKINIKTKTKPNKNKKQKTTKNNTKQTKTNKSFICFLGTIVGKIMTILKGV
jgi:hypothetical protein